VRVNFIHNSNVADGFGRSDSRAALRDFFEVDANYVTIAALKALVDEGGKSPLIKDAGV
jgi:pyruvate dehydrogenase E1 component